MDRFQSKVIPRGRFREFLSEHAWVVTDERAQAIIDKIDSPCFMCRLEAVLDAWAVTDFMGILESAPFTRTEFCERHLVWALLLNQAAIEEEEHLPFFDPPRTLPEVGVHMALQYVERAAWNPPDDSLAEALNEGLRAPCPLCRQEARLALLSLTGGETDARDLRRWDPAEFCERHRPDLESAAAAFWVHHG